MRIILLDIDGVVSIDRAGYSEEVELIQASIPNKNSVHRIHNFRPDVVSSLNNLAQSKDVEVQFLSNWGAAAEEVFSKYVGLRGIKAASSEIAKNYKKNVDLNLNPLDWYKSQVVLEKVARGEEVMFVDDKITLNLALELDKRIPKSSGWIKTQPSQGLTHKHLERIKLWAAGGPAIRYHRGEKW
jgi:hypothetical protein